MPTAMTTAATSSTTPENTTAPSRTITRRCGSSRISRRRFPIAAPPGISRANIRRRSPITTRRSASIRTTRGPIPTAARPTGRSAAPTARCRTEPRRSGSIRPSRNSSTIAGWISPPMATMHGAIADYDEAIKIRPEAKFLTNRGDAYQARKDYDRAIADYDAALKLDPKFQRAYNNRGAAWRHKGDRGRALQDYAEAVRLNPSDKTAAENHQEIAQRDRAAGLADLPEEPAELQLRHRQAPGGKGDLRRSRPRPARPQHQRRLPAGDRERGIRQPSRRAGADPAAARLHRQAQRLVRPPRLRSAPGDGRAAGEAARRLPGSRL